MSRRTLNVTHLTALSLRHFGDAGNQHNGYPRGYAPAAQSAGIPTLYIIGDSTVHNPGKGLKGWGDVVGAQFDLTKIHVENDAIGGRSSRSYYTEGKWDAVAAKLKPGDFVFMQFGHNDGGPVVGGTGRASLKGIGDETQDIVNPKTNLPETVHTYGWYMKQYVEGAKAKGATPIVFSPIPRNMFGTTGKLGRNSGNSYGGWSKQIADAEGVPFVDLNDIVATKFEAAGPDKVKAVYFLTDHTHTTPAGAELNAESVVEGLKKLPNNPLAPYLLPNAPVQTAQQP